MWTTFSLGYTVTARPRKIRSALLFSFAVYFANLEQNPIDFLGALKVTGDEALNFLVLCCNRIYVTVK